MKVKGGILLATCHTRIQNSKGNSRTIKAGAQNSNLEELFGIISLTYLGDDAERRTGLHFEEK